MAKTPRPISEAKQGSMKEQAKGRAKALPAIPYVKVGKAGETERARAATRADTERVESDRAAEGRRSGFSVQELNRLAEKPAVGGGTVLPHSGVQGGGTRMSDQLEQSPTENNITERVVNRQRFEPVVTQGGIVKNRRARTYAPTFLDSNSPRGATPEQEAAQKKYIADAMATPEGQAYKARSDAARAKAEADSIAAGKKYARGSDKWD